MEFDPKDGIVFADVIIGKPQSKELSIRNSLAVSTEFAIVSDEIHGYRLIFL
jgi:hypothetical protein